VDCKLHQAFRLCFKAHKNQEIESCSPSMPYSSHPIDVANKLRFVGGVTDEDMLAAAYLHDVLEFTDVTLAEIKEQFGERVAGLVLELTRREPLDIEMEGKSDVERSELRSRMMLDEISRMGPDAQVIKLADRLSNLVMAFQTRKGDRLTRYLAQTKRILEIIEPKRNPALWKAIDDLIPKPKFDV
jgi:(p)ppGpp synthase/HD superfamily hydrolase